MDKLYKQQKRHSHPRLTKLALSPLSTAHPQPSTQDLPLVDGAIPDISYDDGEHDNIHNNTFDLPRRSSYIASARSLPQTPRAPLLSRPPSNSNLVSRYPSSSYSSAAITAAAASGSYFYDTSSLGSSPRRARSHHALARIDAHFGPSSCSSSPSSSSRPTAAGRGNRRTSLSRSQSRGGAAAAALRHSEADSSAWLLQTAGALAVQSAEAKGQTWLAQRESSTSLTSMPSVATSSAALAAAAASAGGRNLQGSGYDPDDSGDLPTSRRGSSFLGRDRGQTTAGRGAAPATGDYDGDGTIQVDFVDGIDEQDEELAIEIEDGLADEGELRRLLWGRVGGWMDWAVGWMDWRDSEWREDLDGSADEEGEGGDPLERAARQQEGAAEAANRRWRQGKRDQLKYEKTIDLGAEFVPEPAPPEGEGLLGDARWLFNVARSSLS